MAVLSQNKREQIWYVGFALLFIFELVGRWIVPFVQNHFWKTQDYYTQYFFAAQDSFLYASLSGIFANTIGFSVLCVLGIIGALFILKQKYQKIGLGLSLGVLFVAMEIQPTIYHVGDTVLIAFFLSLLFGGKYKFFFVQLFTLVLWSFTAYSKMKGDGWWSNDFNALELTFYDPAITYPWLPNLLGKIPYSKELLQIGSVITPLAQAFFAISMFICFFKKAPYLRFWGAFVTPGMFCLILFFGTTVGLLPAEVFLGSASFLLTGAFFKFKKIKWVYGIPCLYLFLLVMNNFPSGIQIGMADKLFYRPFSDITKRDEVLGIDQIKAVEETPWITHRFTRLHAKHKHELQKFFKDIR